MKGGRYIYVGAILIALVASWIVSHPIKATANRSGLDSPRFVADPFWPKPLPNGWVTGEIGGTCVDSRDHVFIVTRRRHLPARPGLRSGKIGRAHV